MSELLSLSGFIVGLLVGMTGVGGGALMTPLLVIGFAVPPAIAVGTDLLFAAVTKCIGTAAHGWQGTIQWRIVGLLATGSIPATLITIELISGLQQSALLSTIIQYALSTALLLTATTLLFKNKLLNYIYSRNKAGKHSTDSSNQVFTLKLTLFTILAGILLGILVTLTSIGAGALGVAMLTVLYPGLSTNKIVGTDIAHAVPLTAIAGFGHFQLGNVDTHLLFLLLLGSIPGVYIGSRLTQLLPEKYVRYTLSSILFLVGVKLIT